MKLSSMTADDVREDLLLFLRKSRHVSVFEQVRTVLVIVRVRHVQADFMQPRRPAQDELGEMIVEAPLRLQLTKEFERSRFDPLSLREVDVIATLHRPDAAHASIFVRE